MVSDSFHSDFLPLGVGGGGGARKEGGRVVSLRGDDEEGAAKFRNQYIIETGRKRAEEEGKQRKVVPNILRPLEKVCVVLLNSAGEFGSRSFFGLQLYCAPGSIMGLFFSSAMATVPSRSRRASSSCRFLCVCVRGRREA